MSGKLSSRTSSKASCRASHGLSSGRKSAHIDGTPTLLFVILSYFCPVCSLGGKFCSEILTTNLGILKGAKKVMRKINFSELATPSAKTRDRTDPDSVSNSIVETADTSPLKSLNFRGQMIVASAVSKMATRGYRD